MLASVKRRVLILPLTFAVVLTGLFVVLTVILTSLNATALLLASSVNTSLFVYFLSPAISPGTIVSLLEEASNEYLRPFFAEMLLSEDLLSSSFTDWIAAPFDLRSITIFVLASLYFLSELSVKVFTEGATLYDLALFL